MRMLVSSSFPSLWWGRQSLQSTHLNETQDTLIFSACISSLGSMYQPPIIGAWAVVSWSRSLPACESRLFNFQNISKAVVKCLVAWNQLQQEYLHHENWQARSVSTSSPSPPPPQFTRTPLCHSGFQLPGKKHDEITCPEVFLMYCVSSSLKPNAMLNLMGLAEF